MKTKIAKLTLEVIRKIECFWYFSDKPHRFTDDQFIEFLNEQLSLGIDDIEVYLDLDNAEAKYWVDSPANQIYFFESIIYKERKEAREAFEQENSDL